MNKLILVLRYLVLFPILAFVIWLFNFLLLKAILWFSDLSQFWLFAALATFGLFAWVIFSFLATLVVHLSTYIVPNRNHVGAIAIVLSVLWCVKYVYGFWALTNKFSSSQVLDLIVLSFAFVALAFSLIRGTLNEPWAWCFENVGDDLGEGR